MAVTIQGFGKAIGCHLMSPHLAHGEVAVLDAILDVVVVDINVLCTLVMAISGEWDGYQLLRSRPDEAGNGATQSLWRRTSWLRTWLQWWMW
jgi:hypothetical protein